MAAAQPNSAPLWLVGAGNMARQYARVLAALGCAYEAIGRGADSAADFKRVTGHAVRPGGLASFLTARPAPARHAIVAVPVKDLAHCTVALIEHGVGQILVEKPAGLSRREIERVVASAGAHGADVHVAYNRRFNASTRTARQLIDDDGGAISLEFEFNEKAGIGNNPHPPEVKARWFLANSTHVVDLAFFLAGAPESLTAEVTGTLPWHPTAATFSGAGRTERGVPFRYRADWRSAGAWGVEVRTSKRRLVLRPLETLQHGEPGAPILQPVAIDDALDTRYKAGVHRQTTAFLAGERGVLCSLAEHHRRLEVYCRMAGYPD